MMKPKHIALLLQVLIGNYLAAQLPSDKLTSLSNSIPIEKVYLHFDREQYAAGETVFFKAYLYSEFQPDTISTTLYTELINQDGQVLRKVILPILLGTASGSFQLPDTLSSDVYLVRSYSPTQLNFSSEYAGRQQLTVYGRKKQKTSPSLRLEFFPEGGNLVTALPGTVAFKLSYDNGYPASGSGKIINSRNETVTTFSTYHDGMGLFELTPGANESYTAILDADPNRRYELPKPAANGISITMIPHPQGNFFEIHQHADPAFQVAYMIGQMQHRVVFTQQLAKGGKDLQGVINTQHLHSGVLQVTFFNKDHQPLAERLCFVDNGEYKLTGQLITDTTGFAPHEKNRFSIQLKDTVRGSFSISVTDADFDPGVRSENIYSNLLLTSDLRGYVHQPSYYFSGNTDSIKTALDLLMMTNGWRRFNWTTLSPSPKQTYVDPAYITLAGKVTLRGSKKPFANRPLLVMLITADSTRRAQLVHTDVNGNFRLDSMLFFGRSQLLFSDVRGKKNEYIDVHLTGDSITRSFQPGAPVKEMFAGKKAILPVTIDQAYEALLKANGVMLTGVTVKAKKKNPLAELEERYTSGLFSDVSSKTVDLVNSHEADPYMNILDYIGDRINGVQVIRDGPDYQVFYRANGTVSGYGSPPMIIYLNEVETDAAVIATIPGNQVALVKVFPYFAGASGGGVGGVLAVYTRKDADMNNMMQHAADLHTYNGYTISKEFYAPDYSVTKPLAPDNRITIDWRPAILVNNIDPKIPFRFYNNDRTKNFKIVVEGMTIDGKMLHLEEIVGAAKKGF